MCNLCHSKLPKSPQNISCYQIICIYCNRDVMRCLKICDNIGSRKAQRGQNHDLLSLTDSFSWLQKKNELGMSPSGGTSVADSTKIFIRSDHCRLNLCGGVRHCERCCTPPFFFCTPALCQGPKLSIKALFSHCQPCLNIHLPIGCFLLHPLLFSSPKPPNLPHLSCIMPHLAHTCHSGHDALVVAFPWNLTEKKVYLIIIWIVGVCNGMSRYKSGIWRHKGEKTEIRVLVEIS